MTEPAEPAQEPDRDACDEDPPGAKWAVVAAVVVLLVALALLKVTWETMPTSQGRGEVGDYIGGHLAGLGNIAAFLLMFAALVYQKHELRLQRRELEQTREEMKLQRLAADKSADAQVALAGSQHALVKAQESLALATRLQVDQRNLEMYEEALVSLRREASGREESVSGEIAHILTGKHYGWGPEPEQIRATLKQVASESGRKAREAQDDLRRLAVLDSQQQALAALMPDFRARSTAMLGEVHDWRCSLASLDEERARDVRGTLADRLRALQDMQAGLSRAAGS